jgi:hypothetical protein
MIRFQLIQYCSCKPKPGNSFVSYYTVNIYDAEYTGEPISIDGHFSIKNHNIKIENPLEPIIQSSANITVHVRETDTDFESFISEMVGAEEMRFIVTIERNDTGKIFTGHLVTDGISYPDEYYPFDVQLTVSDGLNRLKNIEYRNANDEPFTGYATIAQHLINAIKRIGYTYSGDDVILKTFGFKWIEHNQSPTDALIDGLRVFHTAWQEYATYPDLKCANCYEVLQDILIALNARIFQSDGVFVVQQINDFTSAPMCIWKHDGTLISSNLYSRNVNLGTKRTDGEFSFYPAVREASVSYTYKYSLDKNNLLPTPCPINVEIGLSTFSGSNNHFLMNLRIRSNFDFTTVSGCCAVYKIGIKVGDNSLQGRYSTAFGNIDMNWQAGIHYYYVYSPLTAHGNTSNIVQFETVTPAFDNSGDGIAYINFVGLYLTPDIPYSGGTEGFTWAIEKFQLIQLQGSTSGNSGQLKYTGKNLKSDNVTPITSTVVKELGTTGIGDGPTGWSVSKIDVLNQFGYWVKSSLWKPFAAYLGEELALHKLRLMEYLSMHKKTIRTFEFTYLDFIKQYQALYFNSDTYLIIGWELDTEWDAVKVTGWKIEQTHGNIQIYDAIESAGSSGGMGGGLGYGNPSEDTHVRLHTMDSAEDHAKALEANYNKLVATNATTGAIEYIDKIIQYWQRTGTGPFTLSPATSGDNIDSLTGYLVGALKATKLIAKADGTTAIQVTKADGTTVILNLDTNGLKAKLIAKLSVCPGADNAPLSTVDIAGSIGLGGRMCIGANGGTGTPITMQDTESVYYCDTRNGDVDINLTAANSAPRRTVWIRQLYDNAGMNYATTIKAAGTEKIYTKSGDAATIAQATNGMWVMLQTILVAADTWKWHVVASSGAV